MNLIDHSDQIVLDRSLLVQTIWPHFITHDIPVINKIGVRSDSGRINYVTRAMRLSLRGGSITLIRSHHAATTTGGPAEDP